MPSWRLDTCFASAPRFACTSGVTSAIKSHENPKSQVTEVEAERKGEEEGTAPALQTWWLHKSILEVLSRCLKHIFDPSAASLSALCVPYLGHFRSLRGNFDCKGEAASAAGPAEFCGHAFPGINDPRSILVVTASSIFVSPAAGPVYA